MVEQIVGLLSAYPVSEITLEQDGAKVFVRRVATPVAALPEMALPPAEAPRTEAEPLPPAEDAEADALILTAPMVGLFHHLGAPVRYGGSVAAGQTVGHIESMKLMNDVLSEHAGRVAEVLVEDGAAVEYGQPLFRLTPQDA